MKEKEVLFKKFGHIYPAGTLLFQEGEACSGMFMIIEGRVRLFKKMAQEEITIDLLGQGDIFGEMACLINQPRTVNAMVEEDSQIIFIETQFLDSLFRESPEICLRIFSNLAHRLKKVYEIAEKLAVENANLKKEKELS
ncbi:MAG: Crp/Fnr family transcriptional regulator [Thermodesulfobacteriota bacterium]